MTDDDQILLSQEQSQKDIEDLLSIDPDDENYQDYFKFPFQFVKSTLKILNRNFL